jgi:hypothetical protein
MRISRTLPIAVGLSLVSLTGVADATSTTCATSTVCAEFINSSSGVAIHGEANTGIGIRGTSNGSTGFYGASRSGSTFFPGVEGESLNHTGDDAAGAFGLTGATGGAAPAYGVIAYGSSAGGYGVTTGSGASPALGAPATFGLEGVDGGGSAENDANVGVFGSSLHGTGIAGFANISADPRHNLGFGPIGVVGAAADDNKNPDSIGVEGAGGNTGVLAYNTASAVVVQLATPGYILASSAKFTVDNSANIVATSLTTSKGSYVRTTGASGATRMSYPTRATAPVMEDFGEAQLANGRGYVRLDPALSDVIDNRNAYHVFLTPEGDCNGLYVTGKSPAGFTVRELHGGRSAISFEYRILAKPIDDDAKRLALAPPLPNTSSPLRRRSDQHIAAGQLPLDPLARLRLRVGPAAYARMLKAALKAETGP